MEARPITKREAIAKLSLFAAVLVITALGISKAAATDWLTYHFDNARDGANTNETALTPANVNTNTFFRLFTCPVDAEVYAEPLYMANVAIAGQGTHDALFVATENNTVYAFDADSNFGTNGGLLWKTNLGVAATSALLGTRYYHNVLNPLIGITGTPVIDPVSGTLYVDTVSGPAPNTIYIQHHVHALNIADGSERPNSPVLVTASVPGVGVDSANGIVTFNATNNDSRPALTLAGGVLYVAFSSFGDTDPFHGWVIGFNATNLAPMTNYAFVTTPNATRSAFGVNAGEASIWMGGDGLCADSSNNLYFETGNGSFSAITNGGDYGDSFIKLSSSNRLAVADYFSPSNQAAMAAQDLDLGSGGSILLPDSVASGAHPHLLIGAGKEGTFYLIDRDNMGHFSSTSNAIVETAQNAVAGTWGTPAYYNHWIYNQSEGDTLKAFSISNGVLSAAPVSRSTVSIGGTGYAPTISANGTSNGIVWVIDAGAYEQGGNNNSSDVSSGPSVLRAFNATNLSQQLYNSSQKPSDTAPGAVKYPVATVADGKVFVAGDFGVAVYGLGVILPPPVISPNGGVYTNTVTVTLSDATNDVEIYYTLNGTTPTTNSFLYIGPFAVTKSVELNAIAARPGAFNSVAASASFINSSSIGSGTGLTGQYWAQTSSQAFTNADFSALPTLTRIDPTVDFNWGAAGPGGNVGATNYVVRWTGSVQPQFSERYAFSVTADDGARLFVNGRLVINDWISQSPTTRSGSIMLSAQQLYSVELDYFYGNDSGSQVSLSWSSPSTPQAIIPQTQLYPYTNPPPSIVLASPTNGAILTGPASVTLAALADAPYNPIAKVDYYADGSLIATVTNSPYAPLYPVTVTGFLPNPGGTSSNSAPVSAVPSASVNLVTTTTQGSGTQGWNVAIWQTNNGSGAGTGPLVGPPVHGNSYSAIFNGTQVGNALNSGASPNNTRVRNPTGAVSATFPGDSLTLETNTELREKEGSTASTMNFPGPIGGGPGLILNGGVLNCGESGAFTIAGAIEVAGQSYLCNGENGAGGGLPVTGDNRQWNIAGQLSGSGGLVVMDCEMTAPQIISGASNTFSGQWIVQCGWLQASGSNSLGTNSITVDPGYTGYLTAMPGASSPSGPALLEVNYNLISSGTLTLANGGMMNLHENCTFAGATIEGTPLGVGIHSYSELVSSFPNSFVAGGSGSITVSAPSGPNGPPGPVLPPTGLAAAAGNSRVALSWNASAGASSYTVSRAATPGGPYTPITNVTETTYTDMGLTNGATYYYVVSATEGAGYTLTAVATDGSGLAGVSAPAEIYVTPGSGSPYGLTARAATAPFLKMPTAIPALFPGNLPTTLSGTGAFSDVASRTPAVGLIPYAPNTPLWSDNAVKSRYMAIPYGGGQLTPDQQIAFLPTNSWTFPAGTVFVKNFDLVVNATNANVPVRRLETRLLVRDESGGVYGVTYKWRPDDSDADLLTTSLNENILVTNANGVFTQTWYYPSPADCLTCHTPVANYVLGVNTRQLNGAFTYAESGQSDNQLRALNHLGLFYPAFDEAAIGAFPRLSALTNASASLEQRARSYLDANCAQCHQPGGTGITFDARYDTPLTNQNITNYPAAFSLGYDGACIVKGKDVWRSILWERMNTTNAAIKMPTLARNLVDTNAVEVMTDWINSLPGVPALAPPIITPNGGAFNQSIIVTLEAPDTKASIRYTLDGTLPTTNALLYSGPLTLTSSASLEASAFEAGFNKSVAAGAQFSLQAPYFTAARFLTNGQFQLTVAAAPGHSYVLESSVDLAHWTAVDTNAASGESFVFTDAASTNSSSHFYRVIQE